MAADATPIDVPQDQVRVPVAAMYVVVGNEWRQRRAGVPPQQVPPQQVPPQQVPPQQVPPQQVPPQQVPPQQVPPQQVPPQQVPPGQQPHGQDGDRPLRRRVCYCCAVIPFILAFCSSALSVVTLAIKNEEVKEKCDISCLLSASHDPNSTELNCWIAWGAGGGVCVVAILFILSLVIRLCCGTKFSCPCALLEVTVLTLLLVVASSAGVFFAVGVEGSLSTLKEMIAGCGDDVIEHDVLDFLRQSEIASWVSIALVGFALVVWIVWTLKLSRSVHRRPRAGGEPGERDRLLN